MAEKFYSKYKASEIEEILKDSDEQPFVIYYDKKAQVYRFFRTEERMEAWVRAYESGEIPEEIAAYEFTNPFTAPAPYSISINGLKDQQYILLGTTGNTLEYTFATVSGNGEQVDEAVDVYYTFKTSAGTVSTSRIYNANQTVRLNIDDYISIGTNVISLLIRGRLTGTTRIQAVTYYVVELSLTSQFNIAEPIVENTNISVKYRIKGQGGKTVEFYIDGNLEGTATHPDNESDISTSYIINNSGGRYNSTNGRDNSGIHTLQMRATMSQGDQTFFSNLLYYEFVIKGSNQTVVLIEHEYPSTENQQILPLNTPPGLTGEQYVPYTLNWAYYSSNPDNSIAVITWRLHVDPSQGGEGYDTTLATRNADIVTGQIGIKPEPLNFMPTDSGSYFLQALLLEVSDEVISNYTIYVAPNSSGLYEASNNLRLKLSGLGRSNDEPDTVENPIRSSWISRVKNYVNSYSTSFYNQPWNDNSGWKDDALILNNGATAMVDIMPFDSNPTENGCVVELDFETFNVTNDDAVLVQIGQTREVEGVTTGAQLLIKPSQAILRSNSGTELLTRFKSDERVKIAFVIYPTEGQVYKNLIFVYSNGIFSGVIDYDELDNFNVANQQDFYSYLQLGNAIDSNGNSYVGRLAEGKDIVGCGAGIKIYYMRVYGGTINMSQELNNFIIDSGDITRLVTRNNIYETGGNISIDKLESTITTVKITGPLDMLINKGDKNTIYGALEITSPSNSNINMHCDRAFFKNAGQSTLDKPIPSLHVKLNQDPNNVCYDRDGNILPKNRWAFREGNVPERKFRLQANYMDSSCAHNGAFFRLFNEIAPRVKIGDEYVLRMPAEQYVYEEYQDDMRREHPGVDDPRGLNWKFPYTLHMVPDSIPCILVWREDNTKPYQFLGQYVIMEEKKANYSNGMHSIYDNIDDNGYPDPFQFTTTKNKNGKRLWNNEGCYQMELLTSTDDMTLFLDDKDWNEVDSKGDLIRRKEFELVYPDEDDLTQEEINAAWNLFNETFLGPLCDTKGNEKYHSYNFAQDINNVIKGDWERFDELLVQSGKLNIWHFAAYYCLGLRNCCSDSWARNMEITSYDGGETWLPKWWDVDMQCGLYQTGECNLEPMTLRSTIAPGTNDSFALSGRVIEYGQLHSSWLWDGLEHNDTFKDAVKSMDKALYDAGWNYNTISNIMDNEYVNTWSEALYNNTGVSKYLNWGKEHYTELQGSRTPHRHWFLKTSYDYFDAVNVCGEYTAKTINVRTEIIKNHKVGIKAGIPSYFGWGTSISQDKTGIRLEKGQSYELIIDRNLQLNNPLHIYSASKLEKLDLSDVAIFLASNLDLSKTYDEVSGTFLRQVILGLPNEDLFNINGCKLNVSKALRSIGGIEYLTKVEEFSIQGLRSMSNLNFSNMSALKKFYAAGTTLTSFNPANGSNLTEVQLPTTVQTMRMNGCSLTNNNQECSISWFRTTQTTSESVTEYRIWVPDLEGSDEDSGVWISFNPNDPSDLPNGVTPDLESSGILPSTDNLPTTPDHFGQWFQVTYTSYNYTTVPADIPTTLNAINFVNMGRDTGALKLLEGWLEVLGPQNDTILSGCTLNYSNIYWVNPIYDQEQGKEIEYGVPMSLMRTLARIPKNNRTITGYIKVRGTANAGAFTSEEMNFLLNEFGENIFNFKNALCIDGVSGNTIISAVGEKTTIDQEGVMHILQGTTAQLSAVGFPLPRDNEVSGYEWIYRSSENGFVQGTDEYPYIYLDDNYIHFKTGYLTTVESATPTKTYQLIANRSIEGQSTSKPIDVEVYSRTYPSSCRILLTNATVGTNNAFYINNSGWQITNAGTYTFSIEFNIELKYKVETVNDLQNIENPEENDFAIVTSMHNVYKYDGTNWNIDSSLKCDTFGMYTYIDPFGQEIKEYYKYDGNSWSLGDNFDGTMDDEYWGEWTLTTTDNTIITLNNPSKAEEVDYRTKAVLIVKSLPGSQFVTSLKYTVNWKNGTRLESDPLPISIFSNAGILTGDVLGNPGLYNIFNDDLHFPHEDIGSYKALELKAISGSISVSPDSRYKDTLYNTYSGNGTHNVAGYLSNVTELDFENCENLDRRMDSNGSPKPTNEYDIDISNDDLNYVIVKLHPNSVMNVLLPESPKIEELKLGKPTKVSIINPTALTSNNLYIHSSIYLEELKIINLHDNKTFSAVSQIVSNGGTNALTLIDIEQSKTINETVNSGVIDNIASILTDRILTDLGNNGNSKIVGKLTCTSLYESSYNKLSVNKPNLDLIINYTNFYVDFLDQTFRDLVADEWGDGYGVIESEASTITDFGTTLQNTSISDLSDLGDKLINITFNNKSNSQSSPFYGCSNLSSIKLPSSLVTLGSYTFVNLDNLTNVDFSLCTNLTSINTNAFSGCDGVINISLNSRNKLTTADLSGLTHINELDCSSNSILTTLKI